MILVKAILLLTFLLQDPITTRDEIYFCLTNLDAEWKYYEKYSVGSTEGEGNYSTKYAFSSNGTLKRYDIEDNVIGVHNWTLYQDDNKVFIRIENHPSKIPQFRDYYEENSVFQILMKRDHGTFHMKLRSQAQEKDSLTKDYEFIFSK